MRSQPKPETKQETTNIEISRPIAQPENLEITANKKDSFVKMFEDIAIAVQWK